MLVEMHRNVHTLKGDARMVQFKDIDVVCQKLEDLLIASEGQNYRVDSDVDLSVSMALDFVGLLLRVKGDQEFTGIDLNGFVSQVHRALHGQQTTKRKHRAGTTPGARVDTAVPVDHISVRAGDRLATAATKVFLEYLSSAGVARIRLRGVWLDLQLELEELNSVAASTIIETHALAIEALAADLGQSVAVECSLQEDIRISGAAAQALDVALLHSIRNALGHGTAELGDSAGRITLKSKATAAAMELSIRDNGRGIDVEQIRAHALRAGFMHPDVASAASREELLNLLFESRFTTREQVDDIAGRGLGLDVVRDAIQKVGGRVSIDGMPGEGAVVKMHLPLACHEIEIHMFDAYGGRLGLGVPASWKVETVELAQAKSPVDPLHDLQVRRPADVTGLTQAGPPLVLRFEGETGTIDLVAGKRSRRVLAQRICPTPNSFPAEVVTVDGAEVLLLRPARLPSAVGLDGEREQ
jgi:two-component system chemotaxis sensor kinase CheA